MSNCLFITWDGPKSKYLEGLFLPIFKGLSENGHQIHVLQFTWADAEDVVRTKAACEDVGIPYRAASVWKKAGGVGPFTSAICGQRHIRRAVFDWNIDTLMPRSLMPALAVLAGRFPKRLRLIFDADGFSADERVDFRGLPRESATYRILRAVEARTARVADRVLVRTPQAVNILAGRAKTDSAKFYVVGNGRDPAPFLGGRPQRADKEFRLCYCGSIGAQYRPSQMIEIAQCLREQIPNFVFRVFTRDKTEFDTVLSQSKVSDLSWIEVSQKPPEEIPAALMRCDLALALRQPAFSTQGVAPIKLGEYMLAGLPVIATEGAGSVEPLIKAGVMMQVKEDPSQAWPWVRDNVIPRQVEIRKRAQEIGLAYFSLKASVDSYLSGLD